MAHKKGQGSTKKTRSTAASSFTAVRPRNPVPSLSVRSEPRSRRASTSAAPRTIRSSQWPMAR